MTAPFKILATEGSARSGVFTTAHGSFETPAFMPVGTQATVKGVTAEQLTALGAQIVLSNTYHLHLRPGDELIRSIGGLHRFMGWNGPILTDSGGFQVFSLAKLRKVTRDGVKFQSHLDGTPCFLSPERVIEIQTNLGVDIMMILDECLGYPATEDQAAESTELTHYWAERARAVKPENGSFMFGIVQGGMYPKLREESARGLIGLNFDGYAIGGLSVGEPIPLMYDLTESTTALLPNDRVRYLMGVGTPRDLVECVYRGIDMFDCVIPTRSGRFGRLFTETGFINIRNKEFRSDLSPVDSECDCYTCQGFSRAYLSHLTHAEEVLAVTLASIHNLRFYQRLMGRIRDSIKQGSFLSFRENFLAKHCY